MKNKKVKYRAYSLGTLFYCSAYSEVQAKITLRNQAIKKFGKYSFTDFEYKKDETWVRLSFGF